MKRGHSAPGIQDFSKRGLRASGQTFASDKRVLKGNRHPFPALITVMEATRGARELNIHRSVRLSPPRFREKLHRETLAPDVRLAIAKL